MEWWHCNPNTLYPSSRALKWCAVPCDMRAVAVHAHGIGIRIRGTYKTRNEEMGNKKWGNEEMRKWNGNGRQARWDAEVAL